MYYITNNLSQGYTKIDELFDGVRVLKIEGLLAKGKPINIYSAQWIDSSVEDFLITSEDEGGNPVVIRENVDIEITFIVGTKYASSTIDVQTVHDAFIDYITGSDVWIKSDYMGGKAAHCVCLDEYKPTEVKMQRGTNTYILGSIKLHTLDAPN
jgi:hypothetical protein